MHWLMLIFFFIHVGDIEIPDQTCTSANRILSVVCICPVYENIYYTLLKNGSDVMLGESPVYTEDICRGCSVQSNYNFQLAAKDNGVGLQCISDRVVNSEEIALIVFG